MEATEVEIKRQRQDFVRQETTHPLGDDDDAHTGAPSGLCFPRVVYNMVATACRLEDISDTLDLKTNEWLNKAKQLFHGTLKQQAKSSASWHRTVLSRPSQMMATPNGTTPMCMPPRLGGAAATPPATALTSH